MDRRKAKGPGRRTSLSSPSHALGILLCRGFMPGEDLVDVCQSGHRRLLVRLYANSSEPRIDRTINFTFVRQLVAARRQAI